jgi:hypothetical protein
MDEKPFTIQSGPYVVHEIFIRRVESGDFSCVVELEVAKAVVQKAMVLIAMDRPPSQSNFISSWRTAILVWVSI